ncbi:hypothetical protein [Streptomyces sp. NBC_00091]|uniref:hypothetical protein n=1 Tax=Streptomyces sp. NBC_00091 TaxID=2975648 RepID=UPI002253BC44|nr:hypothetical protein [Streptomyces sp. NBC_00091]MCX5377292.1 hypothetical protein [Streptomyces sp. NBC_00091]
MPRLLRAVAVAVALTACVAGTTSCESEGQPRVPRTEPLTEADLRSVLLPDYVVETRVPSPDTGPVSELGPGSPEACGALVDFQPGRVRQWPMARVTAQELPLHDNNPDFAMALSSYTVQEASAVMDSLKKAVPLCGTFLLHTPAAGVQDRPVRVGERPAPSDGDDAVAFDWVPDISMTGSVPITVVRTGGVIATYHGPVRAAIPRKQHETLRAFIAGTRPCPPRRPPRRCR